MHDHDDFAVEPVRGLPEALPEGEAILWQGAPSWWGLATQVFHIRVVAGYFAALIAWKAAASLGAGVAPVTAIGGAVIGLLPAVVIGLGLLALLAWLNARTSVYTITNRRVVLRIGVVLSTAINLPFARIAAAGLQKRRDGSGNIALALVAGDRAGYAMFWPHVRPWRLARPEPMLRAIPDVERVAETLGRAMTGALPDRLALSQGAPEKAASGPRLAVQSC